jgi:hypothetical protein
LVDLRLVGRFLGVRVKTTLNIRRLLRGLMPASLETSKLRQSSNGMEGGGLLNRYKVVEPHRGFRYLRLRQY